MKGTVSPGAWPELLRQLYVGHLSGLLQLSRGSDHLAFRFQQGHVVQLVGGVPEGILAKRAAAELDAEAFQEAVGAHVRDAMLGVLSWPDGYYAFQEDAELAQGDDVTRRVSTGELILESVRRLTDAEVIRASLGDLDRLLTPSTDPMLRYQTLKLTPGDGYTLSRIDGTSTAREVIQLIPLPSDEVEKSLFALLCTGVIDYVARAKPARARPAPTAPTPDEPRPTVFAPPPSPMPPTAPVAPPPAPAPPQPPPAPSAEALRGKEVEQRREEIVEAFQNLKEKTHFEVLGIERASNVTQVKEAYFRLAKRFHPDTQKHPELADLTDKLEAVFIRLGEAYEVLRNPRSRSQYEEYIGHRSRLRPHLGQPSQTSTPAAPETPPPPPPVELVDPRTAIEAVRKAEKALENNQAWDAIQLIEGVLGALEGKPRQRANVLLAKAYLRNPMWVRRAEETLLKVVAEAPSNVEAHFVLAGIYKTQGLKSRATSMYRKVMDLQPDHEGAARELAALAPPDQEPPPEQGGLLKKLFGRH